MSSYDTKLRKNLRRCWVIFKIFWSALHSGSTKLAGQPFHTVLDNDNDNDNDDRRRSSQWWYKADATGSGGGTGSSERIYRGVELKKGIIDYAIK